MRINPSIFKAYDIRGIYPKDLNEEGAYKIAQAYAKFVQPKEAAVCRDVRLSSPALYEAVTRGLLEHGVDIVDIGIAPTEMLYFAVANYGYDGGLMITGSHTPAEYNGIKLVRKKGEPISGDTGIMDIRDIVESGYSFQSEKPGGMTQKDVLEDYIQKVLSVVDAKKIKPFKMVANLNFGPTVRGLRRLAELLPLNIVWLNEEPNGAFPKGRPDPLIPENRTETIELVKSSGADFGAAWDSDADRCFFFDETGRFLSGYFTTAVLSRYFLGKYPGGKVVIDMKQNWAIKDAVAEAGGTALPNRTGHSLFADRMFKENAVFGGEVSGHYFFKDYFYLDSGLIPLLVMLELLSTGGKKMSEIYQPLFDKYFAIEETNSTVSDVDKILAALKEKYSDGEISEIDGVSVDYPDWRFNVRSSNTEPLVRLNLEAKSEKLMNEKTEELLKIIRS